MPLSWLRDSHRTGEDRASLELGDAEVKGADYRPVQSAVYTRNRSLFAFIQWVLGNAALVAVGASVLLSAYIHLEEGQFPFNVSWVAKIAYEEKSWGTPLVALGAVAFTGVLLMGLRIIVIGAGQNAIYNMAEKHMEDKGTLKKVRPVARED